MQQMFNTFPYQFPCGDSSWRIFIAHSWVMYGYVWLCWFLFTSQLSTQLETLGSWIPSYWPIKQHTSCFFSTVSLMDISFMFICFLASPKKSIQCRALKYMFVACWFKHIPFGNQTCKISHIYLGCVFPKLKHQTKTVGNYIDCVKLETNKQTGDVQVVQTFSWPKNGKEQTSRSAPPRVAPLSSWPVPMAGSRRFVLHFQLAVGI